MTSRSERLEFVPADSRGSLQRRRVRNRLAATGARRGRASEDRGAGAVTRPVMKMKAQSFLTKSFSYIPIRNRTQAAITAHQQIPTGNEVVMTLRWAFT